MAVSNGPVSLGEMSPMASFSVVLGSLTFESSSFKLHVLITSKLGHCRRSVHIQVARDV